MNQQQLILTQLLGSKKLTFGCNMQLLHEGVYKYSKVIESIGESYSRIIYDGSVFNSKDFDLKIIGHDPAIADFHKWLNENVSNWKQDRKGLSFNFFLKDTVFIPYNSSKDLLEQSPETLAQIIELITSNQ